MLIQDIKPQAKVSIGGKVERTGIAIRATVYHKPNKHNPMQIDMTPLEYKTRVTVRLVFTVDGVEYTDTKHNREIMDTYMHTGNPAWLKQLEVRSE